MYTQLLFTISLMILSSCDNHRFQTSRKSLTDPRLPPEGSVRVTETIHHEKLTKENLQRAKSLYEKKCAACHGLDGKGEGFVTQRGLTSMSVIKDNHSLAVIEEVIKSGKGKMPAMAQRLDAQERRLVAHYIQVLKLSHSINITRLSPEDRRRFE